MLILAAIWVFVAVGGGTAVLILKFGAARLRPIDRLQALGPTVSTFVPSPALVWRDLVNWVGSLVPASPKSLPQLKRRLMRAGFRNPGAVRLFTGARVCSTAVLGLGTLVISLRLDFTEEHLFEFTAAALMVGFVAPMQYLQDRKSVV